MGLCRAMSVSIFLLFCAVTEAGGQQGTPPSGAGTSPSQASPEGSQARPPSAGPGQPAPPAQGTAAAGKAATPSGGPGRPRPAAPGGAPAPIPPPRAFVPIDLEPLPQPAPSSYLAGVTADLFAESPGAAGLTSLEGFSRAGIPQMLGDQAPLLGPLKQTAPNVVRLPFTRGYKMADNQSPMPQDRVFVAFNYYDNLNVLASKGAAALFHSVNVYREFFGIEKTFFDQNASIGIRLPLNTLSAESNIAGMGGTSTALGDLTVFVKAVLWKDLEPGRLLSAGLAVTPPNGPGAFAGSRIANSLHTAALQPFLGYIVSIGENGFAQGFSGVNVPTDPGVVTMMYNDFGVGYFLYRAGTDSDRLLSAVVPTFEVHVNTPLNHRLEASSTGFKGTPDVVDLTFGAGAVFRRSILSVGIVNPVTGPRPFDLEVVVMLNVLFGRSRALRTTIPPPAIGP
jgi:hypothetical protein